MSPFWKDDKLKSTREDEKDYVELKKVKDSVATAQAFYKALPSDPAKVKALESEDKKQIQELLKDFIEPLVTSALDEIIENKLLKVKDDSEVTMEVHVSFDKAKPAYFDIAIDGKVVGIVRVATEFSDEKKETVKKVVTTFKPISEKK